MQDVGYKQAMGTWVPELVASHAVPGIREQSAAPGSHSLADRGDTGRVQAKGQNSDSL